MIWRGDSHYGRAEAREWMEDNDTDYIFGLAGHARCFVAEAADNLRFHHAMSSKAKLRTFASFANIGDCEPVVARPASEKKAAPIAGPHEIRCRVSSRLAEAALMWATERARSPVASFRPATRVGADYR